MGLGVAHDQDFDGGPRAYVDQETITVADSEDECSEHDLEQIKAEFNDELAQIKSECSEDEGSEDKCSEDEYSDELAQLKVDEELHRRRKDCVRLGKELQDITDLWSLNEQFVQLEGIIEEVVANWKNVRARRNLGNPSEADVFKLIDNTPQTPEEAEEQKLALQLDYLTYWKLRYQRRARHLLALRQRYLAAAQAPSCVFAVSTATIPRHAIPILPILPIPSSAFLRCPPPLPIHAIPILLMLPTPILPIQAAPNPQSRKHSAVAGTSRSGRRSTYGQRVRVAKSPPSPSPAPRDFVGRFRRQLRRLRRRLSPQRQLSAPRAKPQSCKRIRIASDPSAVVTAKAVVTANARDPSPSPPKKRLVDAAEKMARKRMARTRRREPAADKTGKAKRCKRPRSKIKKRLQKKAKVSGSVAQRHHVFFFCVLLNCGVHRHCACECVRACVCVCVCVCACLCVHLLGDAKYVS